MSGYAVTDADGRYSAHLSRPPRALPVRIVDCDSGRIIAMHVPSTPVAENEPHDIQLTTNTLRLRVTDAANGQPIAGARVNAGVLLNRSNGAGHFFEDIAPTDERGETTVANVPSAQDLIACARAEGYEAHCVEPFVMGGERERRESISLRRQVLRAGRVRASSAVHDGWIAFVSPAGQLLESADLSADGSFTFSREHAAPEYAVIVAANLPMLVLPLPDRAEAQLDLAVPAVPSRDLQITIGPSLRQEDALIGLYVGGRYVPDQVLFRHQALRGMQSALRGRGPLRIPAIAETGPIHVMLGPAPGDLAARPVEDVFLHPELIAGRPVKEVGATGIVVFE